MNLQLGYQLIQLRNKLQLTAKGARFTEKKQHILQLNIYNLAVK